MNTPQHETTKESAEEINKIDPEAPAGSANSLGAKSVRDGRPATDDSVVEAIDELGRGFPKLQRTLRLTHGRARAPWKAILSRKTNSILRKTP